METIRTLAALAVLTVASVAVAQPIYRPQPNWQPAPQPNWRPQPQPNWRPALPTPSYGYDQNAGATPNYPPRINPQVPFQIYRPGNPWNAPGLYLDPRQSSYGPPQQVQPAPFIYRVYH